MSSNVDNTLERFGIPAEESDPELLVNKREVETTTDSDLTESITDDVADGDLKQSPALRGEALETQASGRLWLSWCPACETPFSSYQDRRRHLGRHSPTDFGLAPLGDGRRRGTCEIFDGHPPFETGDNTLPWEGSQ